MLTQKLGPTTEKERHLILDVLRGLALADIALANFPEFALWTFLSPNEQAMMPTAEVDKAVRFLQFAFVDGKFYTIFSILFGIGFSLILARRSVSLFLRRMLMIVYHRFSDRQTPVLFPFKGIAIETDLPVDAGVLAACLAALCRERHSYVVQLYRGGLVDVTDATFAQKTRCAKIVICTPS